MRIKHIVLPIVALAMLSTYAAHSKIQTSKFNSNLWIADHYNDVQKSRVDMLSPLVVHVLKVGMSLEDIDELLGVPDSERRLGDYSGFAGPQFTQTYKIKQENSADIYLVLEFAYNMKLMDYYIDGSRRPLVF